MGAWKSEGLTKSNTGVKVKLPFASLFDVTKVWDEWERTIDIGAGAGSDPCPATIGPDPIDRFETATVRGVVSALPGALMKSDALRVIAQGWPVPRASITVQGDAAPSAAETETPSLLTVRSVRSPTLIDKDPPATAAPAVAWSASASSHPVCTRTRLQTKSATIPTDQGAFAMCLSPTFARIRELSKTYRKDYAAVARENHARMWPSQRVVTHSIKNVATRCDCDIRSSYALLTQVTTDQAAPATETTNVPALLPVSGRKTGAFATGGALRLRTKVLPEHARGHNRSLVLQTLYSEGQQSRADVARSTGLTRVTVSELVAELMSEGLLIETGQREGAGPGKPATLLDIDSGAFQIIGLDLSEYALFRGAVLDLRGDIVSRAEIALAGSTGVEAVATVLTLIDELLTLSSAPILGIGVGSPGIVDLDGVVLTAPNLGWKDVHLRALIAERFGTDVVVANDANAAVLAEHSFGNADRDMMLIKIGHGVGAGLLLGGSPLVGSRYAAGEIGHVVVGTDGGNECSCGKFGCLETWLATPRLDALLASVATPGDRGAILAEAGRRLGIALSPIVGALNLSEIVVSGPAALIDGALILATSETIRARTIEEFHGSLVLRMTALGDDIVMRGAAVMVISARLGVS